MLLKTIGTAFVVATMAFAGSAYAAGSSSQQSQNGAYCLQKQGQATNCRFASLAACNKAKVGSDKCIQNPQHATTGSGMTSPATKSAPKSK
jgi:hypothetical protein